MLARLFGCVALTLGLCVLAVDGVDAGGKKPEMKEKKDEKKDAVKEFREKDALVGVVKSVDKKDKSFVALMKESKRERTFGITKNTEFYGPRGGDRSDTGIDDECLAPGHEIKIVPVGDKDGRNAAQIMFDVAKPKEKEKEKKKAA